jgi:hypothetical protein
MDSLVVRGENALRVTEFPTFIERCEEVLDSDLTSFHSFVKTKNA